MEAWVRLVVAGILDAYLLYCERNGLVGYHEANRMRGGIAGFVARVQDRR